MKLKLLSLLFLAACSVSDTALAQIQFAPADAEWYHNMSYGVFHSSVSTDTLIDGIACRLIKADPEIKNPAQSPPIFSHYRFFIYNNADTVFIYNELFQKFTPLYVFNVTAGDTVCLPALPPYAGGWLASPASGSFTDSNFCFIIDSVKIKGWDNRPLKTIYTHHLNRDDYMNNEFYPDYSFGEKGAYVERLGGIETGFLPNCLSCGFLLSENAQPIRDLRCYTDNQDSSLFSVKLVDTCDNGSASGMESWSLSGGFIRIYPNPASEMLHVSFSAPFPGRGSWTLSSAAGRKALQGNVLRGMIQLQIDLHALNPGVYFLKVNAAGYHLSVQKITVIP